MDLNKNVKVLLENGNDDMKKVIMSHLQSGEFQRESSIQEFKERRIKNYSKNYNLDKDRVLTKQRIHEIYQTAYRYCLRLLLESTCMSVNDILQRFSTHTNKLSVEDNCIQNENGYLVYPTYKQNYWFDTIKKHENIIPLKYGMDVPKRKDLKTNKIVDIRFTITWYYQREEFIRLCNEYFKQFNLGFEIEKSEKRKNSWKLTMYILDNKEYIFIPKEIKGIDHFVSIYEQEIDQQYKERLEREKEDSNSKDSDSETFQKVEVEVEIQEE